MSTISPLPRSSPSLHTSAMMSPSGSVPTSSTATSVRNPLHLKVNRLLSSHLEDSGTRAALDTLGELELAEGREGGAGSEKPIADGLRRGGLRKEVDARIAKGSRDFLDAFGELKDVSGWAGLLSQASVGRTGLECARPRGGRRTGRLHPSARLIEC